MGDYEASILQKGLLWLWSDWVMIMRLYRHLRRPLSPTHREKVRVLSKGDTASPASSHRYPEGGMTVPDKATGVSDSP